jgi:hydroxymethylglutaryl-CoA synthase
LFSIDTSLNGVFSKDVFDFWRPTGHRVPVVNGKYSLECYLMALEGALSHFRSNNNHKRGEIMEKLDYIIYHLPYCNMSKKAHWCFTEIENNELNQEKLENIYSSTYTQKVMPGLLGAKEVGNIYTGSAYMSLISLLESEKINAERKNIGIFSYGSGCGAEFMLCRMKSGIERIIDNLRFLQQIERRKKITFEQYTQFYSKSEEEIFYYPQEAENFKDQFTRFVFTGFNGHKRTYI